MTMNSKQKQTQRALDRLERQYEKELIRNYQIALKELRRKLADLYEKTDGNWAAAQKYNRLAKLEQEIAQEIGKLTGKTAKTLQKGQRHIYEESYYRTAYILSSAVSADLGYSALNTGLIKEAIDNPLDRVGFLKRNRDNQARLTRQLREHLTQGLVQGYSYGNTAKMIKNRMDIGASNALTIARTENHRVRNKARMDSMIEGEKAGLALKRQWMSSIDGDTREEHGEADGQTVDLEKPFDVDGEELMYPGDPSGSASNVINCRCELVEIVEDFTPNTRRVKGVGVTEYATYKEFKKKGLV